MAHRVAALLLAAGRSSRMGRSKPLLPLGDKPVVRHCADALVGAGIRDVVVIVGKEGDAITHALRDTPALIVRNELPESEMSDSVRVGVNALEDRFSGVLVCLSDQPLLSAETVRSVAGFHETAPGKIIIPSFQGKRGHPVLFPRAVIREILPEGAVLRDVVKRDEERVLLFDVPDEGVVLDMDSREDYQRIIDKFTARTVTISLTSCESFSAVSVVTPASSPLCSEKRRRSSS